MKIVVTELIWEEGLQVLREFGETIYDPQLFKKPDELKELLKDADGLVVRNQTKVTAELLAGAPKLKVVGRLGVGLDNIDVPACKEKGIAVTFGRNANAISVAEHVFAFMLVMAKNFYLGVTEHVKAGGADRKKYTGFELYGKTLGCIGIGDIAARVVKRAIPFGMKCIAYDPFVHEYNFAPSEFGVKLVDLETILKESDYITIHVPLLPSTKNMISKEQLAMMKRTAYIINTSRGGIIDELALADALKSGQIAGAMLDVMEKEPSPPDHPLFSCDNIFLTPHVAGLTEESQVRTSVMVAEDVVKVLKGQKPAAAV